MSLNKNFLRPVTTQKSYDGVTALVSLDEDTIIVARASTGMVVWKVIIEPDEIRWVQHAVINNPGYGIFNVRKVSSKQIIFQSHIWHYIYDVETGMPTILAGLCNVDNLGNYNPSRGFSIKDVHSGLVAHKKLDDGNIYVVPTEIAINNDAGHPVFFIPRGDDSSEFDCIILSDCCIVCGNYRLTEIGAVVNFRVYNPKIQKGPDTFSFTEPEMGPGDDNGMSLFRINDTHFAMRIGVKDDHQVFIFNTKTGEPYDYSSDDYYPSETCYRLVALDDHTLVGIGRDQQLFAWTQKRSSLGGSLQRWNIEYDYRLDLTPLNPDNPEHLYAHNRQITEICKMSDSRFAVALNMSPEAAEISTVIIMETAKYDPIRECAMRAARVPHPNVIMRSFLTFDVFKFIVNYMGYWAPYPPFEVLVADIRNFMKMPIEKELFEKLPDDVKGMVLHNLIKKISVLIL